MPVPGLLLLLLDPAFLFILPVLFLVTDCPWLWGFLGCWLDSWLEWSDFKVFLLLLLLLLRVRCLKGDAA